MSAYLVNDCQLTALSAYALRHRLAGRLVFDDTPADLAKLGDLLKRENVKSLLARYDKSAGEAWPEMDTPFAACSHAEHAPLEPMAIIKAAHNYAYQACEHDGWREGNLVRELMESIVSHAIRSTAEYKAAEWGYDCDHSRKLISLASMANRRRS